MEYIFSTFYSSFCVERLLPSYVYSLVLFILLYILKCGWVGGIDNVSIRLSRPLIAPFGCDVMDTRVDILWNI